MSKWIDVNQRVPEALVPVLAYVPDEGIGIGYFYEKDGWDVDDVYTGFEVTHWMPLPEYPDE